MLSTAWEFSSRVLCKFPFIWLSILYSTNQARDWWNKSVINGFSQYFKSIYLKYPKSLQSERKYDLSISKKMWQHVSDPEWDHIFSHFSLTYLVYILFLSYVVNIHLLLRQEGFGIFCKLIPNWIELTWAWKLFPAQYRARIQNQIRNTNWISISISHRVITLTSPIFFYWKCILIL